MRITTIRTCGKALRLLPVLLLLFGLLFSFAADAEYPGYKGVYAEIPVSGTGTFVLKDADGKQVAKLTLDGKKPGTFKVGPFDEPVSPYVSYTITSTDKQNKKIYDVEVYVTVKEDSDELETTVVIRDRDNGVKKPMAYYPVMIDPPVKKVLYGNAPTTTTFYFLFEGVSVEVEGLTEPPMPEGSKNGKKLLSVEGPGETEAGEIWFDRPGVYTYRFTEVNSGESNYAYDYTTFTLVVTVTEGENGLEVKTEIKTDSGETVDKVKFTNYYLKKGIAPGTGDQANPLLWSVVAILALAALIVTILYLRKKNRKQKRQE